MATLDYAVRSTAADLLSDGENPEYDRGITELVSDLLGLSTDDKYHTLANLRLWKNRVNKHTRHAPAPHPCTTCAEDRLTYTGHDGASDTFACTACGALHTTRGCCDVHDRAV